MNKKWIYITSFFSQLMIGPKKARVLVPCKPFYPTAMEHSNLEGPFKLPRHSQHNATQYYDIQAIDTQHYDAQHNNK